MNNSYHQKSAPLPTAPSNWTTDLYDCFNDIPVCCFTYFCPCIVFGRIAEIVDRGGSSSGGQCCLYAFCCLIKSSGCNVSRRYRTKLRQQYNLPEEPCIDLCVHAWCEGCALCQEYRELQNRGFDMSIGWHGNLAKQKAQGIVMPPVAPGGMNR